MAGRADPPIPKQPFSFSLSLVHYISVALFASILTMQLFAANILVSYTHMAWGYCG